MASKKDSTVNETVKVQPYISTGAYAYLKQLLDTELDGNSINSVAQRLIEDQINILLKQKKLKRLPKSKRA